MPVVGIAQPVANTYWYLIAKMDQDEFYKGLSRQLLWICLALALLLLGGCSKCTTVAAEKWVAAANSAGT